MRSHRRVSWRCRPPPHPSRHPDAIIRTERRYAGAAPPRAGWCGASIFGHTGGRRVACLLLPRQGCADSLRRSGATGGGSA
eukprot:scaffold34274_cov51-Isochrysis_galbana.AAC.1